jgi:predicted nucleic acid-binding protein
MIVLDTNVVSELMRAKPAQAVVRWVNRQPAADLYLTSISQAEILHGILLLPEGKRRNALANAANAVFNQDFGDRILPFGSDAEALYALIAADRRRRGRPISGFDAQIAAIARSMGAGIATRNVDDFSDCGVIVTDPWQT